MYGGVDVYLSFLTSALEVSDQLALAALSLGKESLIPIE
jgi:hypothetical protein